MHLDKALGYAELHEATDMQKSGKNETFVNI